MQFPRKRFLMRGAALLAAFIVVGIIGAALALVRVTNTLVALEGSEMNSTVAMVNAHAMVSANAASVPVPPTPTRCDSVTAKVSQVKQPDGTASGASAQSNLSTNCLAGCTYDITKPPIEMRVHPGTSPVSQEGKACVLYLSCDKKDGKFENCQGPISTQPGQSLQDFQSKINTQAANFTAQEIVQGSRSPDDVSAKVQAYAAAGGDMQALQNALNGVYPTNETNPSASENKNNALDFIQPCIQNPSECGGVGGNSRGLTPDQPPPPNCQNTPSLPGCTSILNPDLTKVPPGQFTQPPPGPPSGPPPRQPQEPQGFAGLFGGGGGLNPDMLMGMMSGLMRGMNGPGGSQPPPGNRYPQSPGTCGSQYMCQGNTMYYRNSQCVDQPMQYCQYGCLGQQCSQQPLNGQCQAAQQQYQSNLYGNGSYDPNSAYQYQPQLSQCQSGGSGQYGYGTDGQPCSQPPQKPIASTCTIGTWKALSARQNNCTTGWQCVPSGQATPTQPTATLACGRDVVDVGVPFSLTYSCTNATDSAGGGFDTMHQTSGATSTSIATPPSGSTSATYSLTCINQNLTAGAQCTVQVNTPSIVMVGNPSSVKSGSASTIGWVTSGMKSCVVSSPQLPDFTTQNASNTSVNGVATTPTLTALAQIILTCNTLGGGMRTASTTISIK